MTSSIENMCFAIFFPVLKIFLLCSIHFFFLSESFIRGKIHHFEADAYSFWCLWRGEELTSTYEHWAKWTTQTSITNQCSEELWINELLS